MADDPSIDGFVGFVDVAICLNPCHAMPCGTIRYNRRGPFPVRLRKKEKKSDDRRLGLVGWYGNEWDDMRRVCLEGSRGAG